MTLPDGGAVEGGAVDGSIEAAYAFKHVLGAGVYGTVYMAKDRATGRSVAIKMITNNDEDNDGVPSFLIREVACLRDFQHPNIVELLDIHCAGSQTYIIFECVEGGDLSRLLKAFRGAKTTMPMNLLIKYSYELLNGLHACHQRLILHRDLKPANMLIGSDGLKIADFGLARTFTFPVRCYTHEVITLWYRAPEILLGSPQYGPSADMWSVGCIIAEMATNMPTFPGDSEIGTVFSIFKKVGTPSDDSYPGLSALPHWRRTFPQWSPTDLAAIYDGRPEIGVQGAELLRGLLTLNPEARFTARKAKAATFFKDPEASEAER